MSHKKGKVLHLPNRYLPHIFIIGIAIGLANHFLNPTHALGKTLLVQVVTSSLIGYGLLTIIFNQHRLSSNVKELSHWIKLGLAFAVIGVLTSEIELMVRSIVHNQQYQALSGKGIYIFNAIISVILGFTFNQIGHLHSKKPVTENLNNSPTIEQVPVRKGKDILLVEVNQVVYFEASDNFSFLIDSQNQKLLCDSSLRQLEGRLPRYFLRVHRSYLVNTQQISRISSYGKGRYALYFNNSQLEPVISGSSYAKSLREMLKV